MTPHRIGLRPPADWQAFEHRYVRPVIGVGCAYEAVAIGSNRLPTISELVHRLYRQPAGRLALAVLLGWLGVHLAEREVVRVVTDAVEEAGG